jgi:predicted amidophosphoribosyltransferase
MNRRTCINCQSSWNSLADHELETPHTCPRCGDQLSPIAQRPAEAEPKVPARTQARG